MDLQNAMLISSQGMRAQGTRMKVISENMANSQVVGNTPDEDPYQRQIVTFKTQLDRATGARVVQVNRVIKDDSEFPLEYSPSHPGANADGYIRKPNVNSLVEVMDMREAQRSYEANINMVELSRGMLMKTIDMLRN